MSDRVQSDINISPRITRRHSSPVLHSENTGKPLGDINDTLLSLDSSFKCHRKIINTTYLATDLDNNEDIILQQDANKSFYVSYNGREQVSLSNPYIDKEFIGQLVKYCLNTSIYEPVQYLISIGKLDPNDTTLFGDPLIHYVIENLSHDTNFTQLLQFLINNNYVNINQLDSKGNTPLLKLITLDFEYYPEYQALIDPEPETNIQKKMIYLLLKKKPNLEIKGHCKMTALEYTACHKISPELTKLLLENNAEVHQVKELPSTEQAISVQEREKIKTVRELLTEYGWTSKAIINSKVRYSERGLIKTSKETSP